MISIRSVGWNPSTTKVVSPFISVPSVGSVPPMWCIGGQLMVPRSGKSWESAIAIIARAISARWLMAAPFGYPVVPLV